MIDTLCGKNRRFRHLFSQNSALCYRHTLKKNSTFWEFMVQKHFRVDFYDYKSFKQGRFAKMPPHDFAIMIPSPPRIVGPYSVFFSFALIMDRFFRSDFFCHKKWKVSFQNAEPLSAFLTFKKRTKCPHSSLKIQNVCQKINKNQI